MKYPTWPLFIGVFWYSGVDGIDFLSIEEYFDENCCLPPADSSEEGNLNHNRNYG
jgi:hypothetical protein